MGVDENGIPEPDFFEAEGVQRSETGLADGAAEKAAAPQPDEIAPLALDLGNLEFELPE
eukprot:m.283443 g.283443  ORF g.283443 m.283443 type:complete len:59 (-) comp54947_c0_seq3:523-699(-)